MPWGRVASLDARRRPAPASWHYGSAATVAYVVQVLLLYWCTALLKTGPEWTTDGTALYYALSLDQLRLPLGEVLYGHPALLRVLTFGTWYLELGLPFLLLLPVGVRWARLTFVGLLLGFHLGIALTLYVGLFWLINIVAVLGLLPGPVLDWLARHGRAPHRYWRAWRGRLPAWQWPWQVQVQWRRPLRPGSTRLLRACREGLVLALLLYVAWWNLDGIVRTPRWLMSEPLRWLGYAFRTDQHWGMFAPEVFKDDGWFILEGTTRRGRVLDLNRAGRPVRYAKPRAVVALFPNDRWRKYSENYLFVDNAWMRPYYCNYLLRIWHQNPAHPPLRRLDVVYMKEVSLPDYRSSAARREVLCSCAPEPAAAR